MMHPDLHTSRFLHPGQAPRGKVVAVIGAGFSGTMAAIQLRRALPPDHLVVLLDRSGRFARGPAYAASDVPHLLNVRAGNMSAFPDDPGHFERFVSAPDAPWRDELAVGEAGTFATRRLYGRYLRALLYGEMVESGGCVRLCAEDAAAVEKAGTGWRVRCTGGRTIEADAVVVAVGNLPSLHPADGAVFHDPWAPEALAGLRPGEPVLVVGTGLTMVDLVLGAAVRGFEGPVIALSRRGLLPQRHRAPSAPHPGPAFSEADRRSALGMLRAVRRSVAAAKAEGIDWRAVIDGMRPHTAALWQGLPDAERARFLRHLRPFWDVHRHRMAPAVADVIEALLRSGRLTLRRGRVGRIETRPGPHGPAARVALRDGGEVLEVQRVILATGAGKGAEPGTLLGGLVEAGHARPDAQGLGIAVTGQLEVIGRDGTAEAGLWALGPVVRGTFWECTSVPDIRVQAARVAAAVAAALG